MIQNARVRQAPMTGLGKSRRKLKGLVYLREAMIKEHVVILTQEDYQRLLRTIRPLKDRIIALQLKLEKIRKVIV